jgi:hypothetical protein
MGNSTELTLDNPDLKNIRTLRNFFIGNIKVKPMSKLNVNGFMIGNIIVEDGASVHINGFLIGNIVNKGQNDSVHINGWHLGNKID